MKKLSFFLLLFGFQLSFINLLSAQEVLIGLSSVDISKKNSKESKGVVLQLPFFDDFSDYEGFPSPKRWLSMQAYVGKSYARQAPTVGMVTLDALDENGDLYPQASTNPFTADTLTSQQIRLDSITGTIRRPLHPEDSIILSFFYVPGGWYGSTLDRVGSMPSSQDSLFLEFYDAIDSSWIVVWATPGFAPDTLGVRSQWPWRFVSVKVDDPRFLTSRFQFRFRNYASLDDNPKSGIAANCDQWNIDYVYLNYGRTSSDSLFRDIAFVEQAPSMLRRYQAMPARQFTSSDMASNLNMLIVNRYNQTLASHYGYIVTDKDGSVIANYDGGLENIPAFFPDGRYQTQPVHCTPPINFSFPVSGQPKYFDVVHVVREGVGGDNHQENDTIRFKQVFANYFAYDDGSPENGYGVTRTGPTSSKMYIACRHYLHQSDTLTAVDLFFNRTRDGENENVPFVLCVWSSNDGVPSEIIYKGTTRYYPEFDGLNRYHRYKLERPVVVSDTIFVGFEQHTTNFINIGFDRNTDSRSETYYRVTNEWSQSIWTGSIMMRPCFGQSALLDITEPESSVQNSRLLVYPNPVRDVLHVEVQGLEPHHSLLEVIDLYGRKVKAIPFSYIVDVSDLPGGLYFLVVSDKETNNRLTEKFIIR